MYDSGKDYEFDKMTEEMEVAEIDRIAMLLEKFAVKFQVAEDKEYIIAEMGGNSHE